jgi:5'(3')-deoxyribonucleotidase
MSFSTTTSHPSPSAGAASDASDTDTVQHALGSAAAKPASSSFKPVVACDIDEVLNQFVAALSIAINATYGTSWHPSQYHSYHFHDVWGGPPEETVRRMTEFMGSPHLDNLEPMEGARHVLSSHLETFEFVVVTSRNLDVADRTKAWVNRHFPGIFSRFEFSNHYGKEGRKMTKGELCRSVGAIALLDDNVHYIREASSSLGTAILFGEYRWNRLSVEEEQQLPPNVVRAVSWAHADAILRKIAAEVANTTAGAACSSSSSSSSSPNSPVESSPAAAGSPTSPPPPSPRLLVRRKVDVPWSSGAAAASATILSVLEMQQEVCVEAAAGQEEVESANAVINALVSAGEITIVSSSSERKADNNKASSSVLWTVSIRRTPSFLARRFHPKVVEGSQAEFEAETKATKECVLVDAGVAPAPA